MKTRETHLVLDLWVAATRNKHLHYFDHVSLACQMHGRVEACVLIILYVAVRSVLDENFNERLVFGFHRKLLSARKLT